MSKRGRPVLITGTHRSGTTWTAAMLALGPGTTLIPREPFNVGPGEWAFDGLAKHWFSYAPALDQQRANQAARKILAGRTGALFYRKQLRRYVPIGRARGRLIIKDPIAALSSEWLAQVMDANVLVLVRHPGAFAQSLKRMQWRFEWRNFLDQPELMTDVLAEHRPAIEKRPDDIIAQAGLLWVVINDVLRQYADRRPAWIVRRHEDLSVDAAGGFRDLYARLDLPWTDAVQQEIEAFTAAQNETDAPAGVTHSLKRDSAANVSAWKDRLTPGEKERLRDITEPLSSEYYTDAEW